MTNRVEDENRNKDDAVKGLADVGRRKAVKTLVGGVSVLAAYHVLPTRWETPIIESIFLPAHAATSGTSLHDPCAVTWLDGFQDSNTVVVRVSGFVTPPTSGLAAMIVATGNPDTTATATVNTTTGDDGTFSATLTLTTSSGLTSVAVTTTVAGADGSAECSVNIPVRNQEDGVAPSKTGESFDLLVKGDIFNGTMNFNENIAAVTSINISGVGGSIAITSGIGTSTLVLSGVAPGDDSCTITLVVEDSSGNPKTINSNSYFLA